MAKIEFNGTKYDDFDLYKRKLHIQGAQPTNFTDKEKGVTYDYVTVAVPEVNRKDGAVGKDTAHYRFGTHEDIKLFDDFELPILVEATMVNGADKNGDTLGMIIDIDFANAQEVELVLRQKAKPVPQATPAPATPAKA